MVNINEKTQSLDLEQKKEFKRLYKYLNRLDHVDWEQTNIDDQEYKSILDLTNKKISGEDITFDVGFKYFRENKIFVEPGVFVPQYDTEGIVDILINTGLNKGRALEVGTGTGAIAISVAKETNLSIDSIDINSKATDLAIRNAKENNVEVNFFGQDIFEFFPTEKYDILISNPPYINEGDKDVEGWVKENQPSEALYADLDGYSFYNHLVLNWKNYVKPGGYLLFEIGYNQAKTLKLLSDNADMEHFEVVKDLENNDRFVLLKTPK